jgi:hypothetical protein
MKFFLSVLLISIFGLGILYVQVTYRIDVLFYEINRDIQQGSRRWGTLVNLIPDNFSQNESFASVTKKLERAGYVEVNEKDAWARYKDRVGGHNHMFEREANMWVCNIKLYVFIELDDSLNLISAEGTQQEHGCL